MHSPPSYLLTGIVCQPATNGNPVYMVCGTMIVLQVVYTL
uniref:Uncharacterized protein n=1 Tax=Arundo donax TaxID=35708 RepID=A0A0A9AKJ0_ARUDO